jgi:hypothetical protein
MRALSPSLCDLRKRSLVQAAHIAPESIAAVVNGLALCAIHHLAFARNALGIDSDGVVHIAKRLLEETDGPMLRTGLQGFHGAAIGLPRKPEDRPDRAPRRAIHAAHSVGGLVHNARTLPARGVTRGVPALESPASCRTFSPAKVVPASRCCSCTSRVSQHTTSWEELIWQPEP